MYKQLIQPDKTIKSEAGWCLWFVQEVYHTPHLYRSAWNAWEATNKKHYERAMPDVSVPVFFEHLGTYGTPPEYGNWGHVVAYIPGLGYLSSPGNGYGQKILGSLEEIESYYNCKYVGWSEDLSNVKIVEDAMRPITKTELYYTYYNIYGIHTPDEALLKDGLLGQDYAVVNEMVKDYANKNSIDYMSFRKSTEKRITELDKQITDLQNQPPKEVIKEVEKIVGLDDMTFGQLLSAAFKKLLSIK